MGIPEVKQYLRDGELVQKVHINQATTGIKLLVVDSPATFHGLFISDINSIKKYYTDNVFEFKKGMSKMVAIINKLESLEIPLVFCFDGRNPLKDTTTIYRHGGPRFVEKIKTKLNHIKKDTEAGMFNILLFNNADEILILSLLVIGLHQTSQGVSDKDIQRSFRFSFIADKIKDFLYDNGYTVVECSKEAEGIKIMDFDPNTTAIVSTDSDTIGFTNFRHWITMLDTTVDDDQVEYVNLGTLPSLLFSTRTSIDPKILVKVLFTFTGNDFNGRITGVGFRTALEGITWVVNNRLDLSTLDVKELVHKIGTSYFLWLLSEKGIFIHPKDRIRFINRWMIVFEYYSESGDSFAVRDVSVYDLCSILFCHEIVN